VKKWVRRRKNKEDNSQTTFSEQFDSNGCPALVDEKLWPEADPIL